MVNPLLIVAVLSIIGSPLAVDSLDTKPNQGFINQVEVVGEEMKLRAGLINESSLVLEYDGELSELLDETGGGVNASISEVRGLERASSRLRRNIRRMEAGNVSAPGLFRALNNTENNFDRTLGKAEDGLMRARVLRRQMGLPEQALDVSRGRGRS